MDYFVTNNDLVYADQWHEPRLGPAAFTICLEAIFLEVLGYKPEYFLFGKPESIAYDLAERMIAD